MVWKTNAHFSLLVMSDEWWDYTNEFKTKFDIWTVRSRASFTSNRQSLWYDLFRTTPGRNNRNTYVLYIVSFMSLPYHNWSNREPGAQNTIPIPAWYTVPEVCVSIQAMLKIISFKRITLFYSSLVGLHCLILTWTLFLHRCQKNTARR